MLTQSHSVAQAGFGVTALLPQPPGVDTDLCFYTGRAAVFSYNTEGPFALKTELDQLCSDQVLVPARVRIQRCGILPVVLRFFLRALRAVPKEADARSCTFFLGMTRTSFLVLLLLTLEKRAVPAVCLLACLIHGDLKQGFALEPRIV